MCKKHLTSIFLALGTIALLPCTRAIDITEYEATARWVGCCDVCAKNIGKKITHEDTLKTVFSSEYQMIFLDNITNVNITHNTTESCSFKYTINDDADESIFGKLKRQGEFEFEGEIKLQPSHNATIDLNNPNVTRQGRSLCKEKSKDYICTHICKRKYADQGDDWTCATDITWDYTIDTMVTSTLDKYAASLVQVDRSVIVPSGQMTRSIALKNGMTLALDRLENINIEGQMGAKEHGIVTVNATILVYNFICNDLDCSCMWGIHMPPSKPYVLIAPFRIDEAPYFTNLTQQHEGQCNFTRCGDSQETYLTDCPVQLSMENDVFERGREARQPYATIPLLLQFGAYRIQQSNISWDLLDPNNRTTVFPPHYCASYVDYVSNASGLYDLLEVTKSITTETCRTFDNHLNPGYNKVYILDSTVLSNIRSNKNRSSFENSIHTMLNNRDSYPIEAIFGSERIQNMLHGTLNCKQYYYQSRFEILTANLVTVIVLLLTAVMNFLAERLASGCTKQSTWLVGDKPPTIVDIIANWAAITPVMLYGVRTIQCINNGNIGCGGHPVPVNLMVWGLKPYHPAIANELPNGRTYVGDVYLNMNCTTSSAEVKGSQHTDEALVIATLVIGGLAIIARLVHIFMRKLDKKKDDSNDDSDDDSSNNIEETNEYKATYKAVKDYCTQNGAAGTTTTSTTPTTSAPTTPQQPLLPLPR